MGGRPPDDRRNELRQAAPGTIRGDLSIVFTENLIHGSDSAESAEREIAIWFPASATGMTPAGRASGPIAISLRNANLSNSQECTQHLDNGVELA